WRIDQAMIHAANVLPDFRAPDNIRLGITPLYTTFEEIWDAVMRTRDLVVNGIYVQYEPAANVVT
ncbi:MAG: kynureninase, partial [Caldilineaceae bacterium]|nr:kynureninase [Caldilineaceae bacterium]